MHTVKGNLGKRAVQKRKTSAFLLGGSLAPSRGLYPWALLTLSNQSDPTGHGEDRREPEGGWGCSGGCVYPAMPAAHTPWAGPGKPVNINVLLEHTGPARGPEVSVALPTAELPPPRGQSSPKASILGSAHWQGACSCLMPLWGISYKLALPRPDRCVAAAPVSTDYTD